MLNILKRVLSLFFPNRCVMCGDITDSVSFYCGCNLPLSRQTYCPTCSWGVEHCLCENSFYFTSAPFLYQGNVRKAILLLKHTPHAQTISFFSEYLKDHYQQYYTAYNIDLIVPVPMSKTNKKQRRFNQAELLAKDFSEKISVPLRNDLLKRKDSSLQQHSLNRKKRYDNALSSYYFAENKTLSDSPNILIVDDIFTTGATLEACSRALLENGANSVYCITVACTDTL